jgi:hypothetical protein
MTAVSVPRVTPDPEVHPRSETRWRSLEGERVTLALSDGSVIHHATLVHGPRGTASTLWLEINDADIFVDASAVTAVTTVRCAKQSESVSARSESSHRETREGSKADAIQAA